MHFTWALGEPDRDVDRCRLRNTSSGSLDIMYVTWFVLACSLSSHHYFKGPTGWVLRCSSAQCQAMTCEVQKQPFPLTTISGRIHWPAITALISVTWMSILKQSKVSGIVKHYQRERTEWRISASNMKRHLLLWRHANNPVVGCQVFSWPQSVVEKIRGWKP